MHRKLGWIGAPERKAILSSAPCFVAGRGSQSGLVLFSNRIRMMTTLARTAFATTIPVDFIRNGFGPWLIRIVQAQMSRRHNRPGRRRDKPAGARMNREGEGKS
jgi:hypothetical protein